jgi:hypothetical protein
MEFILISDEKIQELLKRENAFERENDSFTCCSVADVFLAVERIKKSSGTYEVIRRIRDYNTTFHATLKDGYLQMISLDAEALQDGLFDQRTQLWELAANQRVTPTHSVRLVTLRGFDLRWESNMVEEAQKLYYEELQPNA